MSTPNRITFTPGSDTPVNPFHTRELNAAELAELLTDGGFRVESMSGVFHGPRLARDGRPPRRVDHRRPDRAGGGRRRLARRPAGRRRRGAVGGLRPARRRASATSTRAWIWWRSRCARERPRRDRPGPVHPRPAHPPALAGPPRPLAGRRGVALPVVVGGLPAADAGAANPGRRRPPRADHPGHDAGGHRAARRPVLPRRYAPVAGQLAAAGVGSRQHCTPRPVRPRAPRQHRKRCASSAFANTHEAGRALEDFTTLWRHGVSPLLRELIDAGTVELLGGPLAHPFQPLLNPRLREFALREGLADAQQRFAHTPSGIWAPECAYAPGMEHDYAAAGVGHFMVDGPSLHGDTALGRPVGQTDVRGVRPRPAGQLPRLVAEIGLPRARRLPRLPHLRPPDRAQAGAGDRA